VTLQRLVLWRHGETTYNATGRWQGQLDTTLSETGKRQAVRAALRVADFQPEVALSSDLTRATATAAAFTEVSGLPVRMDKRLRETHIGEWQGLSGAEVEHGWPGEMVTWRSNPQFAPPGGESRVEVAERAFEVVEELDLSHGGTALLCAHGGLITALTVRMLDWPLDLWPGLGGVANCHWVVLTRRSNGDHRWRLTTYNGGVPE
jgi:2,3-bisphosphoglycerate-dependent phosphoglycerate mutase/probable phosphoglycerate mutase